MMESNERQASGKQDCPEVIPPLIQIISSDQLSGFEFDDMERNNNMQADPLSHDGEIDPNLQTHTEEKSLSIHERTQSISISMPSSPLRAHAEKKVVFHDDGHPAAANGTLDSAATNNAPSTVPSKQTKFYSQPMPTGTANGTKIPANPRISALKDKRFDSFKTWSGRLERQLSNLRGKPQAEMPEEKNVPRHANDNLPVDRYFDALEGPELDTLRPQEEMVLPDDKTWPFLLRFPVSSFGICLGVTSQAIMWKALATSSSMSFLHISLKVNLILWCISVTLVVTVFSIYLLKVILYFEAVRREYYHPIRVNFFFAPWIALLFLALGVPPSIAENLHQALWYVLMTPILCLELKIYGQWMSGGQRRLSKVANPSNHLSIVGNFVGALLGASMGLKEGPIFFFSIGLAHYTVLFVTLYQRLPTNETLPKELHPVFFLFVAAPSVASMAWAKIQGSFDFGSRVAYFISLFLYFSLAVRINFFRGFRFSLAWWAYTFPMTGAATATIRYSTEVNNVITLILSVILSIIATLTVFGLLVTTIIHAFVLHNLFPNDIAIAISDRRPKTQRKWYHLRHGSSDTKDIENYLKFSDSDGKDIEASVELPKSDDEEVKLPA